MSLLPWFGKGRTGSCLLTQGVRNGLGNSSAWDLVSYLELGVGMQSTKGEIQTPKNQNMLF